MSKSICCYMIVQNEQDIIAYSMIYPLLVFDKLIIVDGGSTDETKRVILATAKQVNMLHKLFLYDKPFTTLNDQRNFALSKCDTDFVMYLDADECVSMDALKKIKNEYINQYDLILVRSHHLYIDFFHEAVNGSWTTSFLMPRIYRRMSDIRYTPYSPSEGDHTLMVGPIYFMDFFKGKTMLCDKNDIVVYHYGHARGGDNERKKIAWFMKYDHPEMKKLSDEEITKRASESCYFDPRFWRDHINCDPVGIIKFTGQHPEIMKNHPLYNVRVIND